MLFTGFPVIGADAIFHAHLEPGADIGRDGVHPALAFGDPGFEAGFDGVELGLGGSHLAEGIDQIMRLERHVLRR